MSGNFHALGFETPDRNAWLSLAEIPLATEGSPLPGREGDEHPLLLHRATLGSIELVAVVEQPPEEPRRLRWFAGGLRPAMESSLNLDEQVPGHARWQTLVMARSAGQQLFFEQMDALWAHKAFQPGERDLLLAGIAPAGLAPVPADPPFTEGLVQARSWLARPTLPANIYGVLGTLSAFVPHKNPHNGVELVEAWVEVHEALTLPVICRADQATAEPGARVLAQVFLTAFLAD